MSKSDILLETGTNEVELLEFFLNTRSFALNVLKVRQILKYEESDITPSTSSSDCIMGVYMFHGTPVPVVNLNQFLRVPELENNAKRVVMVCEFNNSITGFLADGVNRIHRVSWKDIQPMQKNMTEDFVTGVAISSGKRILVADFEKIVFSIFHQPAIDVEETEEGLLSNLPIRVLFADDSSIIREKLRSLLKKAKVQHLTIFENGEDLYLHIKELQQKAKQEGRPINEFVSVVVTDIEMPKMDGLTLCRRVKTEIPGVPVIILSSLISDQIIDRCKTVKADDYISKSEPERLLHAIERVCASPINA